MHIKGFIKIIIRKIVLIPTRFILEVYNQYEVIIPSQTPRTGPAWILFNHGGTLDVPALLVSGFRDDLVVITARLIKEIFILNLLFKSWNPIYVDQFKFNPHLSDAIERVFKRNEAICIAPEGTRSTTGKMQPFRSGGIKRALLSFRDNNIPIIPCGIDAYMAMPRGKLFPRPRKITVKYGKPLDLSKWKKGGITASMLEEIGKYMRDSIGELLPPERRADPDMPVFIRKNNAK